MEALENALAEAICREEAAITAESNMRALLRQAREAEDNLADTLADTRSQAHNTERLLSTMNQISDPNTFPVAVVVEANKQATAAALHELVEQVDLCVIFVGFNVW